MNTHIHTQNTYTHTPDTDTNTDTTHAHAHAHAHKHKHKHKYKHTHTGRVPWRLDRLWGTIAFPIAMPIAAHWPLNLKFSQGAPETQFVLCAWLSPFTSYRREATKTVTISPKNEWFYTFIRHRHIVTATNATPPSESAPPSPARICV